MCSWPQPCRGKREQALHQVLGGKKPKEAHGHCECCGTPTSYLQGGSKNSNYLYEGKLMSKFTHRLAGEMLSCIMDTIEYSDLKEVSSFQVHLDT